MGPKKDQLHVTPGLSFFLSRENSPGPTSRSFKSRSADSQLSTEVAVLVSAWRWYLWRGA